MINVYKTNQKLAVTYFVVNSELRPDSTTKYEYLLGYKLSDMYYKIFIDVELWSITSFLRENEYKEYNNYNSIKDFHDMIFQEFPEECI